MYLYKFAFVLNTNNCTKPFVYLNFKFARFRKIMIQQINYPLLSRK